MSLWNLYKEAKEFKANKEIKISGGGVISTTAEYYRDSESVKETAKAVDAYMKAKKAKKAKKVEAV